MRISITQELEQRSMAVTQPQFVVASNATQCLNYPGNFYQGATITEIDESVVTENSSNSAMMLHPQAVQASPVLVLSSETNSHHQQHQRNKLRQKALVESVESKV